MRVRTWIFAAVVALVLAINLALLSLRVAQSGEDTVRERLAQASGALRAQLELVDARLTPRAAAEVPELVEATRSPADPAQAIARPDDRALRAAASALAPEPDLLAVVNAQGALLSTRAKPARALDDVGQVPLAKTALEGTPPSSFGTFDNVAYRLAAARVPGSGAAVIAGKAIDDRFAAQLKSQVDADVTLIQNGKVLASSLSAEDRARAQRWAAAPNGPGYGTLRVNLPLLGSGLSGKLPRGATRLSVRAALIPLDAGVQAVLTVPASPYLGWLARYQAFYLLGLVALAVFGFLWGLFEPKPQVIEKQVVAAAPPARASRPITTPRPLPKAAQPSLLGTDVGEARPAAEPPAGDVPWASGERTTPAEPMVVSPSVHSPAEPKAPESLDPIVPPPQENEPAVVLARIEPAPHPMWSADPFTPTPDAEPHKESAAIPLPPPEPPAVEARKHDTVEEPPLVEEKQPEPFSFAGLLDEAQAAPPPEEPPRPSLAQDFPDTTAPGGPSDELLEAARTDTAPPEPAEAPAHFFPGDEPTRVQPLSAALIDKLRERDDDTLQDQPATHDAAWAEALAQAQPASDTIETAPATMESLPPLPMDAIEPIAPVAEEEPADPDEEHWHDTFNQYLALKEQLGEGGRPTYEKFAAKLAKNRADLLAKHNCRAVRFTVYEKDGKASIKAAAVR